MQNGLALFKFYLQKIEQMMQQAENEPDPAWWLYTNDARTPLFMLEALSRLYGSFHDKKDFKKIRDHFKALEDGIGDIDFYDFFAKAFKQHPSIPVHIREYMESQTKNKLAHVNELLINEGWLSNDANRIKKITKELKKAEWLRPKEEVKAIKQFYTESIADIKKFIRKNGSPFTELEDGVHELRRDIRWLSIYPQALQGMVQFTENEKPIATLEKYMTPAIVNSKFNVMPATAGREWLLLVEKARYYALSWIIAETGKIKDQGLEYFAIAEALEELEELNKRDAMEKGLQILGVEYNKMQLLLSYATEITAQFIKEENFEHLVAGIARTKKAVDA